MKHSLRFLGAAALMLLLASCGNDDPVDTATVHLDRLISHVNLANGQTRIGNAEATLAIDFVASTVDLLAYNGITEAPIEFIGIPAGFYDRGHGTFAKRDGNNDISGWYDTPMKLGAIFYINSAAVGNAPRNTILHSQRLLTKIVINEYSFSTDYSEEQTARYYDLRMNVDEGKATGTLLIHNIQFAPEMPILQYIRIPLEELEVTHEGYTKTIDTLTPYFASGSIETPMPERQIENFVLNVDLHTGKFKIAFDCYGLHFTEELDLYGIWE